MKRFVEEKTHENMLEIMKNSRMARVLVPTMIPENVDMEKLQEESGGKPFALPKGTRFRPCMLRNANEDHFFPVFTDPSQIPAEKKYPAIISVPFLECAKVANKEKEQVKGIAMNPFSENILFQQEILEAMLAAELQLKGRNVVPVSKEQYHLMVRHQIEHIVIPKTLHTKKQEFVQQIEEQGEELLHQIYSRPYDEKVSSPYAESDFAIMALNISEDLEVIRIDLPQKNLAQAINTRVYLTIDPTTDETGYFMIEGGKEKGSYVFAEITKEGRHQILGEAPGEGTELQSVIEVVRKRKEEAQPQEA